MLEESKEDIKTRQLLEKIITNLPAEYKGSEVIICGNYKGIVCDGDVLARCLPGKEYEEIYANKVRNGLGIAVVCGLKNREYEIRKNPLNDSPYFNSGIGMSIFFKNSKE